MEKRFEVRDNTISLCGSMIQNISSSIVNYIACDHDYTKFGESYRDTSYIQLYSSGHIIGGTSVIDVIK